ncbi:MAG TPA: T9SS type A sorting domain-containing protein [Puia sp.]|nr:T9SS type A sorting domain-containing protein [Puia sp.]
MKKAVYMILGSLIGLCSASSAQIQTSASYIDVSQPGGGPIQTGDILEIRGVISVPSGTTITGLTYTSTVPGSTLYQTGTLTAETNEGVVVGGIANTGNYTDAAGDDRGQIVGSAVTIYMGTGATSAAGGTVIGGTTTPVFYSSQSILMAAYRVKVTGAAGATFIVNGVMKYSVGGVPTTSTLTSLIVGVYNKSTCMTPGAINYLTVATNGSFGSGNKQNASALAQVSGFTFVNLSANQPADGYYSVVNNTSPTQYTGTTPTAGERVFGVWDVIGDHTGSSNGTGNSPTANHATGGYMLAINGTYAPSAFFSTTVSGLSTNTDYTVSFWVYNLCSKCGADPSTGTSSGTPGVLPNIAFAISNTDYYNTGQLAYTGQWIQSNFTFNSGAGTSFPIIIRNNAPGGGGNDFAIDDISLSTCLTLLPVTLINFQGNQEPGGAVLDWQTSREENTAYYVVERNTGDDKFDSVGRVTSHLLAAGSAYHFTDNNAPQVKAIQYRLRMVDIDGNFTYSPIVVVGGAALPAQTINLAPNPSHTAATLYMEAEAPGTVQISLWSLAGARVLAQTNTVSKGQNALPIESLGRLAKGMYVVRMISGNWSASTKLVVE